MLLLVTHLEYNYSRCCKAYYYYYYYYSLHACVRVRARSVKKGVAGRAINKVQINSLADGTTMQMG